MNELINNQSRAMWFSGIKRLRVSTIILGLTNAAIVLIGGFLLVIGLSNCDGHQIFPFVAVSLTAVIKLVAMLQTAIAQVATANTIIHSPPEKTNVVDTVIRHQRRIRYKAWLWWTRFAIIITVLQFVGATYLMFVVAKYVSPNQTSSDCALGRVSDSDRWKRKLLFSYIILVCSVALVQCFTGSDVLRWRSFYATQDDAWKAHYKEVFDHGIREALCCLGRIKYMTVSEEDEVYSVARLLGDLVVYRASGTGHLELLAGLALMQRHSQSLKSYEGLVEAPEERLQGAAAFHKFAEAAYTGPLLDVGRHPLLFPCVWLYRQGIFTPWTRNRRPKLEGDNWWRGHAAAFLKYIDLDSSPGVLRRGRVCQEKCEAAYFIVVLHHLRSVVIAVRGTETPEDLITDGLGRACYLSASDLDGLIKQVYLYLSYWQSVESSFPHYGHSGIVEAARDLYLQIEGHPGDDIGFLSSLFGAGSECDGYSVRLVGHSLGGAIAALLGIRLYRQFPNLHVYAYGALPCVDSVVSDACSKFITSIVFDNEFSARLSVGSILRLRADAIMALSQDPETDTTLIFRLARRFLYVGKCQSGVEVKDSAKFQSETTTSDHLNHTMYVGCNDQDRDFTPWNEANRRENVVEIDDSDFINPFAADVNSSNDPVFQFMETVPRSENRSNVDPPEVFLPGLIIHLVPQQRGLNMSLLKGYGVQERTQSYKAYIVNKESFRDIVVSPSMFLDHLPWRCHHAIQKVLEARSAQNLLDHSQIVLS
ncbi:Lipase_3 domain-containing protein [Cephalotus follicularis]|uniref:Lipase_3 domain-containing protein n=1 Tax=Cephalotus follicularis TaxID=3775 RepID=A0A1Q3CRV8_CEPFO|nr:Lipase_3 domain-containing protein [Cephalotus follicularis]